ncbi:MAG: Fic family protein [Phycisphaerales bacterium]|nr:Fic family protein [Phycisphaerales bacterium]
MAYERRKAHALRLRLSFPVCLLVGALSEVGHDILGSAWHAAHPRILRETACPAFGFGFFRAMETARKAGPLEGQRGVLRADLFAGAKRMMAYCMTKTEESHQIDQLYKPFKPFDEWRETAVDAPRWQSLRSRIAQLSGTDKSVLERAQRIARRAAAVETGAIEDLYKSDRGITMTIAKETAEWEVAINQTGEPALVRDQLDAYEGLLDLATQKLPITEAGIRELHHRLCKSQKTYLVHTPVGPQKHNLPLGEYKSYPNHIRKADGSYHAWAPVDMVAPEMHRLVLELQRDEFASAHAVVQAAYAHHAFVTIHPFADGNGRTSRAIASIFLYRDANIPFLFFFDQRKAYYDALSSADDGNFVPWIEFAFEAGIQTMFLVEQTFKSARSTDASDSLRMIESLYVTKSGYTHEQIDQAATRLILLIKTEVEAQTKSKVGTSRIEHGFGLDSSASSKPRDGYRALLKGEQRLIAFVRNARPPANAELRQTLNVVVPKNPGTKDSVLVIDSKGSVEFEARVEELIPQVTTGVTIRVRVYAEGFVNQVLAQLANDARQQASR